MREQQDGRVLGHVAQGPGHVRDTGPHVGEAGDPQAPLGGHGLVLEDRQPGVVSAAPMAGPAARQSWLPSTA